MAQTPQTTPEQEPIIPPSYLLGLAAVGFIVAFIVRVTQPEFGVVGFAGLGFGILALLAWVLLAPQQALGAVTGRTARFGGASLFVTLLLIAALIAIYIVVRNVNARVDLTQANDFSLTEESRQAITALGADPTLPPVMIYVFYGAASGTQRDQTQPLLEDYARASDGKISYEFVDPDTAPQLADLFGITRSGQAVVVPLNEAGEPITDNAELVEFVDQGALTNAILAAAAQGDFNAYFLTVEGGVSEEMSVLQTNMTDQFDWNVQNISLLELTSPEGEFRLNDPNADGEVVVIPGGTQPLADAELEILQNYINAGGELIIFAGNNFNEDETSLATGESLNAYLWENFGVRFRNDVVVDPTQAFQSPLIPVATDLNPTSFITTNGIQPNAAAVVFEAPHSIEISDTLPANVTVTPLIETTDAAYALTDLSAILEGEIVQPEGTETQQYVLAASVENTATGARMVLFGSPSPGIDTFAMLQSANLSIAFNSLIWATDYESFFMTVNVQQQQRPQDQPIFADATTLSTINLIVIGILPFGVLLIGAYVWWNNRERAR